VEEKAASDKVRSDREAKNKNELELAEARDKVIKGKDAAKGTPEYEAMEQALAKLSEKQTETLVANNRELLESLNFANSISVKQLEALNKSDKLSDEEKGRLKEKRFSAIEYLNDAGGLAALALPAGTVLTPDQQAAKDRVIAARKKVSGLSDSELEMVDPDLLVAANDPEGIRVLSTIPAASRTPEQVATADRTERSRAFIAQMKGGQVDAIISNKSGKYTTTQKDSVSKERMRPFVEALAGGAARIADIERVVRGANIKTKVSYMKLDGPGVPPIKIAMDPNVLPLWTPKVLRQMALHEDSNDNDIHELRVALLGSTGTGAPGVSTAVVDWLTTGDGAIDFP